MARKMKTRGFGSIRKLPSGRYQARYFGPDLVRHAAPTTYANKAYAEGWLAAEHRLVELNAWTSPAKRAAEVSRRTGREEMTVERWFEIDISRRLTRTNPIRPTTEHLDRKDFRLRIQDRLGAVPLADLSPADVVAWWESLNRDTPPENARAFSLLARICGTALADELIDKSPCDRLRQQKRATKPKPKRKSVALTAAEVLVYLAAVPEQYRVLLMVAAWCAPRSGEVRALRRSGVDLKAGTLRFEQTVTRVDGKWLFGPTKTEAGERTVSMPLVLVEALRGWLATAPVTGRDGLLFTARDGRSPLNGSVVRKAHLKGAAAVDRPKMAPHDLRKTAATLAAQGGATTKELMGMLGHTTPNMAMLYQVAEAQRDRDRAVRLDGVIADAMRDSG
jgi:integrase